MRICRASLHMVLIVATPLCANAQIGDGRGELPGGPWTPPPVRSSGLSPACQQLLALRDETQKQGLAIQRANERRATVQEGCNLFRTFLAAEAQFVGRLEDSRRACGIPADVIKQAKEGHAKAEQIGKEVCEAAPTRGGIRPSLLMGDFWWPGDRMPGR
jgi:hypothetical protein